MRKLMVLVGLARLLVVVSAGVGLAVTKTCKGIPCNGTDNRDILHERNGRLKYAIFGYRGRDILDANKFFNEKDRLYGGDQGDKLLANDQDGRDVLKGGRDRCYGDKGDRFLSCEVKMLPGLSPGACPEGLDLEALYCRNPKVARMHFEFGAKVTGRPRQQRLYGGA